MGVVHHFSESLAKSNAQADAPWWLDVYRAAFPDLQSCVSIRADGWAQRGGIDRVLILSSGKTLTVDEKVREKDWPDILIEVYSDEERGVPGWARKELACDYIAYAFIPSQRCYLLPFQTLRAACRVCGNKWMRQYPQIRAKNTGYTTLSVAVPIKILLSAMSDAMCVWWGDKDYAGTTE